VRIILTKGSTSVIRTPAGPHDLIFRAYAGGRSSAQRLAVARAAGRAGGAFTVDDLTAIVREQDPRVSTATVYRCVSAMACSGFLSRVGERDGAALWVRCDADGHHHHLVCTSCGAIAHTTCPVDADALAASAPEGFTITSHDVRLYGLCSSCAARSEKAGG
jgi:Fur family ferric uptake transcriptional regulator